MLYIGTFELKHRPDLPFKVVINEGVKLAAEFGGTDSHNYINGVLDKLARDHGLAEEQPSGRSMGLSMGMSADFETAIQLGATHIRVGSALFGARGG